MDVIQVQNEPSSATCPHCGADVALDQRYCLACGRPCSPVRLAFLDVLGAESAQRRPGTALTAPNGYVPAASPPDQGVARLTRYSGLFSLLAVLLLTGVIGLLIGHWVSGGGSNDKPAIYKIEGLGTTGGGAAATGGEGTAGPEETASGTKAAKVKGKASTPATGKAKEATETKEVEEAQKEKLPEAKQLNKSTTEHLKKLSGKAYEKEIEKATESGAPLET